MFSSLEVVVAVEHLDGSAQMATYTDHHGKKKYLYHAHIGESLEKISLDERGKQLTQVYCLAHFFSVCSSVIPSLEEISWRISLDRVRRTAGVLIFLFTYGPILLTRQREHFYWFWYGTNSSFQRALEIQKVVDILESFQEGLLTQGSNTVTGNTKLDVTCLLHRLDLNHLAVAGHSFGGATAVVSACLDHRFKCCVGMDVWWEPIEKVRCLHKGLGI